MPSMALKWDGVKLTGTADALTAATTWIVLDVADEAAAMSYALANAPATYNGIPKTDLGSSDRLSETAWLIEVKYSTKLADQKQESKAAGGAEPVVGVNYEIEFEAAAATTHITRSLRTKQQIQTFQAVGEPAAIPYITDFKLNINDTGDEIQGCDFPPEPHFRWSETHYIAVASVNDEYVRALEEMCGLVNEQTFRNRNPGCVLFRGVSGKRKDTKSYAFSFKFESRRPLVDDRTIEPFDHEGVNADGYDYVWIKYVPTKTGDGKRIVQRPAQLNVEEVVKRADFRELGIGVRGLDP